MRRRQGTEDPGTVPNARALTPDVVAPPPEDVFASFIERSYRGRADTMATDARAPVVDDAVWERSVEELLDRESRETDAERERDRDTDPPPPPEPDPEAAEDETDSDAGERVPSDPSVPAPRDEQGTLRVVLLTNKKSTIPPPAAPRRRGDSSSEALTMVADAGELRARLLASSRSESIDESHAELRPDMVKARLLPEAAGAPDAEWASVVPAPSEATQRREAKKLVPDLARQKPRPKPPSEASEDGLIPGGELDRQLTDMAVLLRYGHDAQVARELEGLRTRYPQDLLLLRRIAEFWAESKQTARALETLFALASGLFERRNVEGMRQALEQALALDPESERAGRLLSLLDQRPAAAEPKRGR